MMFLALAELAYTLIIFCAGHPIEGWTTMMFVLTLGFAGLFAVLTIIIKYLSLLVDLVFKKQNYQLLFELQAEMEDHILPQRKLPGKERKKNISNKYKNNQKSSF